MLLNRADVANLLMLLFNGFFIMILYFSDTYSYNICTTRSVTKGLLSGKEVNGEMSVRKRDTSFETKLYKC